MLNQVIKMLLELVLRLKDYFPLTDIEITQTPGAIAVAPVPAAPALPPTKVKGGSRAHGTWYRFPDIPRLCGTTDEATTDREDIPQRQGPQKNGTPPWSWKRWRVGTSIKTTLRFGLSKGSPSGTDGRPS
jgi:hypothetical protein